MMLSQLFDGAEIRGVHRLSGGASRETWRFEADGRPLILQRQRSGDERDMLIEAGVLDASLLVDQRAGFGGVRDGFGKLVEAGWQGAGLPVSYEPEVGKSYRELSEAT